MSYVAHHDTSFSFIAPACLRHCSSHQTFLFLLSTLFPKRKKCYSRQYSLVSVSTYFSFQFGACFFFLPPTRSKFLLFGEAEAQMKDLSTQTPVLHSYSIGSSTRWTSSFSSLTQIEDIMVNLCVFFFSFYNIQLVSCCVSLYCSYGEFSECLMQNLVRFFRFLLKFLNWRPSTPTTFLLLNKIQVSPSSMAKSRRFCPLCVSALKDLQHILHFHRLILTQEKKIVPPLPPFSAGIVTEPLSLTGWGDDGRSCACTHSGLMSKARNRWSGGLDQRSFRGPFWPQPSWDLEYATAREKMVKVNKMRRSNCKMKFMFMLKLSLGHSLFNVSMYK